MDHRIIVNADDLGLCTSVNTAIFDVFRAGNLSSATLMVNMPGTADAVARLKDHPGLAVGLHFCISEGNAVAGPSSLTNANGGFFDRSTLAKRALKRLVNAADVRREFGAQLDLAIGMGVRVTHTDSHQHTLMLPVIFDAVAPVLAERSLPVRLVDPPAKAVANAIRRPKKLLKQILNKRLAARHRSRHVLRTNDALVSIHDLESPGPYDRSTYVSLLADAGPGVVEVMVHPYILGADLLAIYADDRKAKQPFFERCVAEYEALRAPRLFGAHTLIDFAQL